MGAHSSSDRFAIAETLALRNGARESLGEWLQTFEWDAWFTATFATPQRHPWTAIRKVGKALLGQSLERSAYRAFVAAERHKSGLWHTHGLVSVEASYPDCDPTLDRMGTNLKGLGWSRFEDAHSKAAVCCYLAKYVTKDNDSEYMIYGDWSH